MTAGVIAGLVVLAACADSSKPIAGPSAPPTTSASTSYVPIGSSAGLMQVCVSPSSPAGTYKFANSLFLSSFEDGGSGTTLENAPDGTPYVVAVGLPTGCVSVMNRTAHDETFPDYADTWSSVTVQPFSMPAGAVYDSTNCIEDIGVKHTEPTPCGPATATVRAFTNIVHGAVLEYFFSAPSSDHNCTLTQGYYKNHDSYTAGVLSSKKGTAFVDAAGKLMTGSYHLTAAQVDAILSAPAGKGFNDGGVVFTGAQLPMIHQLITAELNVAGGADASSIASTIATANAGYTSASKAQLSAWTVSLTSYNEGSSGPGHCLS